MEALSAAPHGLVAALMAAFFLLAAGQTVHVFLFASRRGMRVFGMAVLYEVLVVLHALAYALLTWVVYTRWSYLGAYLGTTFVPGEYLLWVNAVAFAVGVALCIYRRRLPLVPGLVVLLLSTPPLVQALWAVLPLVLVLDAAFFLVRVAALLVADARHHGRTVSKLSVIEAINLLPEGILCTDVRGRVLIMNDSMRACLVALGLPTDLADMSGLMGKLRERAARDAALYGEGAACAAATTLRVSDNEIRQFVEDEITLRKRRCRRVVAYDFTEEEQLNLSIARTNRQLEMAGEELRASLANVREVAENDALLRMRSRVHDVIGQRLSILHRYLEDSDLSDESFAGIEPVLGSILDDLAGYENPDPAADLDAIVAAFKLVGVQVQVEGALPPNRAVAAAFVSVIREAVTNAVRHAQASLVSVAMEGAAKGMLDGAANGAACGVPGDVPDDAAWECSLVVSNDGPPFSGELREGSGLPGMVHALREVGGDLRVYTSPRFTICATVPQAGGHVRAAGSADAGTDAAGNADVRGSALAVTDAETSEGTREGAGCKEASE